VLAQVALELLAFVELVEVKTIHDFSLFDRLPADDRIRKLLRHLSIETAVPAYLSELSAFSSKNGQDAPGILTSLRNMLVHATEPNRRELQEITSSQLWQASELAVQHFELSLLALLGYRGTYARRGWRGWRGDDEAQAPWA
jgi:hypothetical protein